MTEGHAVADKKIDELKGRAKEAAGDVADDRDLKQDGQADRASAGAKGKVDEITDQAHQGLDKAKDKIEDLVEKGRRGAQSDR
jgi:uncharacterized protein YjbJ (UPF0337 family)